MSFASSNGDQILQNEAVGSISRTSVVTDLEGPYGKKASKYFGVYRAKENGYEAFVYDYGFKPKQHGTVYLGTFNTEEDAARAHDLVCLKFWGPLTHLNFPVTNYCHTMEVMEVMTDQEVIASVRSFSERFAEGQSEFGGVVSGDWQARKEPDNDCVSDTYEVEDAAMAFDIANIKHHGYQAFTNYDLSCYDVKAILNDNKVQQGKEQLERIGQLKEKLKPTVPLILNRDIRSRDIEMPIRLRDRRAIELPRNLFEVWVHETTNKGQVSAPRLSFQHGAFSPFCAYDQGMQQSKEQEETSWFGFRHASLGAVKPYNERETGESSNLLPANDWWTLPPYQINFKKENWLKVQGLGFKHARQSHFRPFKNKGKSKVVYH